MTIKCRLCGMVIRANNLPSIIGQYLIHTVQQHWEEIELLHSASGTTIEEAKGLAELAGWLNAD
jgi:hypothetical protein